MTVCNMSIEAGARAGLVAPDDTTYNFLNGRPAAPKGADWDAAVARWKQLPTDDGAVYDRTITINASELEPMITFGTNPGMGIPITARIPDPSKRVGSDRARIVGEGAPLHGSAAERVADWPLGKCRVYRKLHEFAHVGLAGRGVGAEGPQGQPGCARHGGSGIDGDQASGRSRRASTAMFRESGAEWREAGCSMCIAMNGDQLRPGEYSVSTSNRNFEGPAGQRWTYLPRESAHGRRNRDYRQGHRCSPIEE